MLSTSFIDVGGVLKTESFIYEPGGFGDQLHESLGAVFVQKRYNSTGK